MKAAPADSSPVSTQTPLLNGKLRSLRARLRWMEGSRRLAVVLGALLSLAALAMLLDWLVVLPLAVRQGSLLLQGLALLGLVVWAVLGFASRKRRDVESLALMVERAAPEFRGRLISAVQFSIGHGAVPCAESAAFVDRLRLETESLAAPRDFHRAIDSQPWKRALVFALAVIVTVAGVLFAGGPVTRALLDRHFLGNSPIPRQTQIRSVAYQQRVGIGDTVTVAIRASGILPGEGRLFLRYDSGQRAEVPLLPAASERGVYSAAIAGVPGSFTWRARLNDARSADHTVTAIPRPAVVSLTLTQDYPGFMNLAPTTHAPGDFHLFPGATVDLEIRANKPVQSGTLGLLGLEKQVPLAPNEPNPERLRVSLSVPHDRLSGFSVGLRDREGMESRELAAYRVTLATDTPPEIRLVLPARSEESVTPAAKVVLAWEATDRFGIREFVLNYRRGESEQTRSLAVPVPADADPREVAMEFTWALDELQPALQPGNHLTLWLEARDVNPATAPGTSRRLQLLVVTAEEKRRQLLGRVTDTIRRLEGVAAGQEQLNEELRDVIRKQ